MEESIESIQRQAKFADEAERQAILGVYQAGIDVLRKRLAE
jgi:hypothetical protein